MEGDHPLGRDWADWDKEIREIWLAWGGVSGIVRDISQ